MATDTSKASQAAKQQISSSVSPSAKSEIIHLPARETQSSAKAWGRGRALSFLLCPAMVRQILPPLTTGQQQLGAPEGRKMKEKLNSKCQETLPDGNCHLLSASGAAGLLSSKKSMSGKLFRFSLQALTPALRDNSQTSFSLLGLTSEPQGSPFLAKYRGFYSSLGPTYVCWCKLET